jgi:hypothetical protein
MPLTQVRGPSFHTLPVIGPVFTTYHFTPTSPTNNLGHAEDSIIAHEGACATQGGAWSRTEIANAVRIGSSIPGSRYGFFSPLVCPGPGLTHESQFQWKH